MKIPRWHSPAACNRFTGIRVSYVQPSWGRCVSDLLLVVLSAEVNTSTCQLKVAGHAKRYDPSKREAQPRACPTRPNDATDVNVPSSGRNMPHLQSEAAGDRPLSSHTNSSTSMSSHFGNQQQPHVDAKQSSGRHASLTSDTSCSSGNAQYLPSQHPHSHHPHHHSRHISHHEEAQMRELDADILELGIDQPGTPVLTAAHAEALLGRIGSSSGLPSASVGEQGGNSDHISPSRLPLLPESAAVTLGVGKEDRVLSASVHSTGGGDDVCLPIASSDASLGKANSDQSVAAVAAPNFPASPVKAYRRCLSGDMETIATVGQSGSDVNLVGSAAEALKTPAKSARRGDAGGVSSDNERSSTALEDRKPSPNSVANGSSTTAPSTIDEAASPCGNRSILDDVHDATIIAEGSDGHNQQQIFITNSACNSQGLQGTSRIGRSRCIGRPHHWAAPVQIPQPCAQRSGAICRGRRRGTADERR